MNDLEKEFVALIIDELNLEGTQPDALTVDTSLYGEELRLDSIDILEVALLISKKHGFELRSGDPDNRKISASLGSLMVYVVEHCT